MKILKEGKPIENLTGICKKFKCDVCDCEWIANPTEYNTLRTPVIPNTYCYCPNCTTKTWFIENLTSKEFSVETHMKLQNPIPLNLTENMITIEPMEYSDGTVNTAFIINEHGIDICELKEQNISEETLNMIKRQLCEIYNNELINDIGFKNMLAVLANHIRKYDNEGWKHRGDFSTPETYKAYIIGLDNQIKNYVRVFMKDHIDAVEFPENIHSYFPEFSLEDIKFE